MSARELDLMDPRNLEDPYDLYERLRTSSPVHEIPDLGVHLVSRHGDILEVVGRHDEFSSHLTAFVQRHSGAGSKLVEMHGDSVGAVDVLAIADPPDHTRQRKIVSRTLREVEASEALIRALAAELVDPFVRAGGGDFVADVAGMLPVRVIASLLGLPDEDAVKLKRWSDDGAELLSGVASEERLGECGASVLEFLGYLEHQLDSANTREPKCILAILTSAVADDGVSRAEAISMALQLVTAGSDSTSNLLASAAWMLAREPDVQAAVRDDPSLVPTLIEEVARLESPFRGHFRVATRDTTLAGRTLPAGTRLFLLWASANRDPAAFEDPDNEFDNHSHFGDR